jgi:hypothetical protein
LSENHILGHTDIGKTKHHQWLGHENAIDFLTNIFLQYFAWSIDCPVILSFYKKIYEQK